MLRIPMIIFMALLIWLSPIEGARTYVVDDSGFANYNTIQEAVVAASNGDTIYIKPGEYNEEVILNRSLTLMPLTGESGPIILKGDGLETGITITAEGCSLEGLTVQDFAGPALYVQSNQNSIKKNVFKNANPAILVRGSHGNSIAENKIMDSQGGVALWENSSDNLVQENEILDCNVSIVVRDAAKNKILRNKISDAYWGIWLDNAGGSLIDSNDIRSKRYGIWLLNSSAVNVAENRVNIENSASVTANGIYLVNASGTLLQSNEINGGSIALAISSSKNGRLMDNAIVGSSNAVIIRDSTSQEFDRNRINGVEYGIMMENSSGNSIKQNTIDNSTIGIELATSRQNNIAENQLSGIEDTAVQITSSNENTLYGNQITDSFRGVILLESSANRLQANLFQNVEWSLYAEAETKEGFNNSIDESNVVDFAPIVYIFGQSGGQIQDRDIAHLTLAYCENVTVKNTAITSDAMFLFDSKNNRILENNISACFGMRLVQSNENEISGNRLLGNRFSGMFLYGSDLNQIAGNNASHNSQNGISLLSCSQNTIRDNVVDENAATGIWLNLSNDNQISQNNIRNNPLGLQVMLSTGNRIFHNNFLDNQEHSQDLGGSNIWDDGNVTGGNYWSGHVAKGNPSQNWPRMIKGGSTMDHYPFQDESGWREAAASPSYAGAA
jgi:parallel beta-helix repeat protein